jgi:putative cardiolipin synthase
MPLPASAASRLAAWGLWLVLALQGCASLPGSVERSASLAFADTADTPLARIASASTPETERTRSGFRVLPSGDYSLDARIALARRATRSIDAQYYQVHDDGVGHRFLRELRDAAARGVRVRLLLDDFYTTGHDALYTEFAAHDNVEVRLFNPLPSRSVSTTRRVLASLHEFGRINQRMHNKLFVADNTLAVVGGRNIGDEYFMSGTAANFIDLDVLASGAVVRQLSGAFDAYWNSEHSYPIGSIARLAADPASARHSFARRVQAQSGEWTVEPRDLFGRASVARELDDGRLSLHHAPARVLVDPPDKVGRKRSQSAEGTAFFEAVQMMRAARSEVLMASPYFIPGELGVQLLRETVGHGVRVSVLTNAADATDEPLVHFAYARYRHEMLRAGVEIHELGGQLVAQSNNLGIFRSSAVRLHAKVGVIDRRWVLVGSMNLDARSARANTEVSVSIESPVLANELSSLVERGGHLAGAYKLRLAADGDHIEWVSRNGEQEVVTRDEPGATPLSRLWLWMLSHFVSEDLL